MSDLQPIVVCYCNKYGQGLHLNMQGMLSSKNYSGKVGQ